jgi:hypothetical protein
MEERQFSARRSREDGAGVITADVVLGDVPGEILPLPLLDSRDARPGDARVEDTTQNRSRILLVTYAAPSEKPIPSFHGVTGIHD